ncbi:hypothetical protein FZEAL_10287 [Fusarium zealandicum]|uniref:SnoaL-like polyketide cyclase n=1 Tax=Fusarium zealandicum TaxID=1053134 RepID=A0A8H4U3F0_9HYPO|nr:hypothetical protein FZEAL_10287 [Fusarium zealandicum]
MSQSTSCADILSLFSNIIDCQNSKRWETLERYLQPTVNNNGQSQPREAFISYLQPGFDEEGKQSRLDSHLVDVTSQALAARLIISQTVVQEGKEDGPAVETFQYQAIVLAWFVDGRLSRWQALQDDETYRTRQPSATSTPQAILTRPSSTPSIDLKMRYHDYIKSINNKTMEAHFHKFCQPTVMHNDREMTTADYISLIGESQECIRDLNFKVQDILVDNQSGQVAARLEFTGVPVAKWANAEPNGKGVRFHEHVMYWLDGGRISWVWSILELDEYRKQLQGDHSS